MAWCVGDFTFGVEVVRRHLREITILGEIRRLGVWQHLRPTGQATGPHVGPTGDGSKWDHFVASWWMASDSDVDRATRGMW